MTKLPDRDFSDAPAVRGQSPLLIGIMSPSGGGKTYSALRLATGMQQVYGGDIYGIDTENKRMLDYAPGPGEALRPGLFKFRHIPFEPPFGSLHYLAAIRQQAKKGARIIIVDSMTHEHIGEGGYLETAEETVTRIVGANATYKDREKVQMLGWATAGPLRQKMIEGIKQLDGAFIFCFRAKEKTKPVKKDGKTEVIDMGFMPIAGEEWVYEMKVNCMLEPRSDGVPTWRSDHIGERMMMKLPEQFRGIFAEKAPLSEDIGRKLAEWACGGAQGSPGVKSPPKSLPDRVAAFEAALAQAQTPVGLMKTWNSDKGRALYQEMSESDRYALADRFKARLLEMERPWESDASVSSTQARPQAVEDGTVTLVDPVQQPPVDRSEPVEAEVVSPDPEDVVLESQLADSVEMTRLADGIVADINLTRTAKALHVIWIREKTVAAIERLKNAGADALLLKVHRAYATRKEVLEGS